MTPREVIRSLGKDHQHEVLELAETIDGHVLTATSRELAEAFFVSQPELAEKGLTRLLPDVSLGLAQTAYCMVPAAPIRTLPNHSAEIWTFAWMGSRLEILETKEKWLRVRLPDKYIGWVHKEQLHRPHPCSVDEWSTLPKSTPATPYLNIRPEEPNTPSGLIIRGSEVHVTRRESELEIQLPDKSTFKAPENSLEQIENEDKWLPGRFIQEAMLYGGIPYLWGGNTPLGLDCSGLIQLTARMCGRLLPRDASQQARMGQRLERQNWKKDWLPGDLLFFGEVQGRITHVAIYVGDGSYLHASGFVRINSLDASDQTFEAYRYETLQFASRIF